MCGAGIRVCDPSFLTVRVPVAQLAVRILRAWRAASLTPSSRGAWAGTRTMSTTTRQLVVVDMLSRQLEAISTTTRQLVELSRQLEAIVRPS